MAIWTFNGTPAADLGISGVRIHKINQGVDTCEFVLPGRAFDADDLFVKDSTVVVALDGTRVFVGRVVGSPINAAGPEENVAVTLVGPWWYLDNIIFQQTWKTTPHGEATLVDSYVARVVLGQADDGTSLNSAQMITAALDWAIDRGAPIAIGDLPTAVTTPWAEITDAPVSEILRTMLRWMPDATAWWDYTTTPNPTLHITRRADEEPQTLDCSSASKMSGLNLAPNWDLQVPSVIIKYEKTNTVDGESYTEIVIDKAPEGATGLEIKAAVMTIDLQGANSTYEKQKIVCAQIHPEEVSWWQAKFPWLAGATDITIEESSATPAKSEELIEGTAPWWKEEDFVKVTCAAKISYTLVEGGTTKKVSKESFSVNITGSNYSSQTFSKLSSSTTAEPTPVGLAQSFYDARSVLYWEGGFTLTALEVTPTWRPGMLVNLTGGRAAWETMDGQIQQVDYDIDSGTTTVTLGAPHHLGPQDLIELARAARGRRPSYSASRRTSGKGGGKAEVQGPANSKESNSTAAGVGVVRQVFAFGADKKIDIDAETGLITILDTSGETAKEIRIRLSDIPAAAAAAGAIELRELDYCDDTTAKKILVLASAPYTAA